MISNAESFKIRNSKKSIISCLNVFILYRDWAEFDFAHFLSYLFFFWSLKNAVQG